MAKGEGSPKSYLAMVIVVAVIVLAVLVLQSAFRSDLDTSESAKHALRNKTSMSLNAGTKLLATDEDLGFSDHDVTHISPAYTGKIWIWDYAKEDKDVIDILVDGVSVASQIKLTNKATEFTLPATGTIEIIAVEDRGDGVTYGIKFQLNGMCYLSTLPRGESNFFYLIRTNDEYLY